MIEVHCVCLFLLPNIFKTSRCVFWQASALVHMMCPMQCICPRTTAMDIYLIIYTRYISWYVKKSRKLFSQYKFVRFCKYIPIISVSYFHVAFRGKRCPEQLLMWTRGHWRLFSLWDLVGFSSGNCYCFSVKVQ